MQVDGAHGHPTTGPFPTPHHIHLIRRITAAAAASLAALALILLAHNEKGRDLRAWNLGLTLVVTSAITGAAFLATYFGDIILRRMSAIEAAERHIAHCINRLPEAAEDEISRRRLRRMSDTEDEDDQGLG